MTEFEPLETTVTAIGVLDEKLRPYATDAQWEKLLAYVKYGSHIKAGKALGCDESTIREAIRKIRRHAAQQGYAPPDITHEVPDGLTLRGTSILYDGEGRIRGYWNKTKAQGLDPEETTQLPDPKKIESVSTMYDGQRKVQVQWVKEKPIDGQREKLWELFAKELAGDLPRIPDSGGPVITSDSLMTVYPVGDHHLGMLAWDKETGDDYDLSISEHLLIGATDYLVSTSPACDQALIIFLGDFMHVDGFKNVTPTSGNFLDADSRFPKMVQTAVRTMRYLIEKAASRHKRVRVIVEIGNHDMVSSIFLMTCLAALYEKNERISVDLSPMHFHYFEFGSCLIGTHHGHGVKMERLPLIMATDRPESWGRTKHRYIYTGHIHHREKHDTAQSAMDYNTCSVESFRVLPPSDAWGSQKGYRPIRDMHSLILHKDFGEVDRHRVNPIMLTK